jgi:hypothetical protein
MEIKGKVHYVGVNDRNKALFENFLIRPIAIRESLLLSSWKKESGSLYANIRK